MMVARSASENASPRTPLGHAQHPFDMALDDVLSKMPKKIFTSDRADVSAITAPLVLPEGETVRSSLDRVLRLLSVGL